MQNKSEMEITFNQAGMNKEFKTELIEAIGYLAKDLANNAEDSDIQDDWKRLLDCGIPLSDKLTAEDIETLREYAL